MPRRTHALETCGLLCLCLALAASFPPPARAQHAHGGTPLLAPLMDLEAEAARGGGLSVASQLTALLGGTPEEQAEAGRLARDVAQSTVVALRAQHCTEPRVARGRRVPAVIAGPQLSLTLLGGNCTVSLLDKQAHCFGPSLSYALASAGVMWARARQGRAGALACCCRPPESRSLTPHAVLQAPLTVTAKHWSPDTFTDGACVFSKALDPSRGQLGELTRGWVGSGQPQERVLASAGEEVHFPTVKAFLTAARRGALAALLGPDAAAQLLARAAAAVEQAQQEAGQQQHAQRQQHV